jgi:uncharacterized lipoprotein
LTSGATIAGRLAASTNGEIRRAAAPLAARTGARAHFRGTTDCLPLQLSLLFSPSTQNQVSIRLVSSKANAMVYVIHAARVRRCAGSDYIEMVQGFDASVRRLTLRSTDIIMYEKW